MAQDGDAGEDLGGLRRAQEATVSLERLVHYWDEAPGDFAPEERLWGDILRHHALDLGLREAWDALPEPGKPMALSSVESFLEGLSRRQVDLAHAHLLVERGGKCDVYLSMPRAFPDLGIMPTPDPRKVSLLR